MALAETPVERGSYLVNSIGACGNCHGRDAAFNRTPDLAGGVAEDREGVGHVVFLILRPTLKPALANGLRLISLWLCATANVRMDQ